MRRIILTILLLVVVTPVTRAGYGGDDTLLLRFDGGAGYGIFRDMGASPLTYKGLEIHPGIGVEWRQANWLLDGSLHLSGGAYGILFRLQSFRVPANGINNLRDIPVIVKHGTQEYELTADYGEAPGKIWRERNTRWDAGVLTLVSVWIYCRSTCGLDSPILIIMTTISPIR